MGIGTCCVIGPTVPLIRVTMTDRVILCWECDSLWKNGQIQHINQTIATQHILHRMGVGSCCVIGLTVPLIRVTMTDRVILCWECDSLWKNGQIQRINQTIATQHILQRMGIGSCCAIGLTVPLIRVTIADDMVICWERHRGWENGQMKGYFCITTRCRRYIDRVIACSRIGITMPCVSIAMADGHIFFVHAYHMEEHSLVALAIAVDGKIIVTITTHGDSELSLIGIWHISNMHTKGVVLRLWLSKDDIVGSLLQCRSIDPSHGGIYC